MITHTRLWFNGQSSRFKLTISFTFFITVISGYFYHHLPEEVLTETISGVVVFSLYEIFSIIMVFILADIIKKDAH
jgi:hypothetical protein